PLATFDFTVNDADPGVVAGTMRINVTNVNDGPVVTVPGAQVVDEDTSLNISGISVSDADDNLDTVALSVSNGTLTVTLAGGATISSGSNGSGSLTLSGTVADINLTLASLNYQGVANYNGVDTLSVVATDLIAAADAGNVGITVNAVNDAPVANDDSYNVAKDQTLVVNALTSNATALDLAAAWHLDEGSGTSVSDATGTGNDGTLNGASWTTSSRTGNSALSFDGVDDYVQTTSSTLDLSTATSFTLSAWFQTDTTSGAHHILWQGVSSQNGWGDPSDGTPTSSEMHLTVGRHDTNDKITFFLGYLDSDANSIDITSASNFTDTSGWHHAVVVVSDLGGGTLQADLYVDGVLEGSDTGTQIDRSQWDSDLLIGRPGAAQRFFDGKIDDIGIYDRALTSTEVSALYQTGVLSNDTDAEGDQLTVNTTPITDVSNGTLILNADGSFTYTPNAGFVGTDTFTYEVSDGALASNIATVTLNVSNNPPLATDDPGDFSSTVNSYSPLSYWRLGEASGATATDLGGTGNDAAYNGVTLGQTGVINGDTNTAIHFDGTDDYVEVAHDDAYLLDDGTIQLWFNADDLATNQGLISKDSNGFDTGGHFEIRLLTNGSIEVRMQSTSGNSYLYSAAGSVGAGSWHHVAVTFGSGGMALYLDGVSVDTNSYTGGLGTTSGGIGNYEPIAIGASTRTSGNGTVNTLTNYFGGSIDEVAVIGQALTPAQIKSLYASAIQNYTLAEDSSLVVWAYQGV
ncbi:MAG: LamG-like jellyroll fold domain-containing protein, partial [Saprospiraceae bacterium]|nr:LamG-like jellyroll fold domain-containing protein [Saprospiraceae bacterium]